VRTKPYATSVLVFDEVELLDVTGPVAVLSAAGRQWNFQPFKIDLVASELGLVSTRSGIALEATHTLASYGNVECLIIPGGYGARKAAQDDRVVGWARQAASMAELVLLVGNGALIAARAGLLDDAEVALLPELVTEVRAACPSARANTDNAVCASGKLLSAARSALGLDLACELVARTFGKKLASGLSASLGIDWSGELGAIEIVPGPLLGASGDGPVQK
jgi:transcriptional regulator GlxA family with amidase domain